MHEALLIFACQDPHEAVFFPCGPLRTRRGQVWQLRLHSFHPHWFLFTTQALAQYCYSSGLTDLSPEFLMTGHWVTRIKHFPIHILGMAGLWTRWFPSLGHLINLWLIYLHSCLKAFPTTLFRTRWPSIYLLSIISLEATYVIMTFPEGWSFLTSSPGGIHTLLWCCFLLVFLPGKKWLSIDSSSWQLF